ncbi:MAG: hypothetical protein N3A66_01800, partial [Planctomycetota bacterium]|nr:hypothetical protein [Planctomycetota bacterium]
IILEKEGNARLRSDWKSVLKEQMLILPKRIERWNWTMEFPDVAGERGEIFLIHGKNYILTAFADGTYIIVRRGCKPPSYPPSYTPRWRDRQGSGGGSGSP